MNVVWFAQSIDNESISVVKSNRPVENQEEKTQLIQKAQEGVSVRPNQTWDFVLSIRHPLVIRGYLQPDQKSANGRKRTGIFMVEFQLNDPVQLILEEVERSLLCLGIEASEQQRKSFLKDLCSRIKTRRLGVLWGLIVIAAITTVAVVKIASV